MSSVTMMATASAEHVGSPTFNSGTVALNDASFNPAALAVLIIGIAGINRLRQANKI